MKLGISERHPSQEVLYKALSEISKIHGQTVAASMLVYVTGDSTVHVCTWIHPNAASDVPGRSAEEQLVANAAEALDHFKEQIAKGAPKGEN